MKPVVYTDTIATAHPQMPMVLGVKGLQIVWHQHDAKRHLNAQLPNASLTIVVTM